MWRAILATLYLKFSHGHKHIISSLNATMFTYTKTYSQSKKPNGSPNLCLELMSNIPEDSALVANTTYLE